MMLFDFEHDQHMEIPFSILASLLSLLPRHLFSLILWLVVIFIAAFAIRRNFQQQILLAQAQNMIMAVHTQAMTDGLTGVWNRQGFDSLLVVMDSQAQTRGCPYSIIIGDVDHLKEFNDTFGHQEADKSLKQLTDILSSQIRSSDAIARYGGDEFAIFCLGLDQEEANRLVERLVEAVKTAPLTMSFGVATFPTDGSEANTVLKVADKRMYQSKQNNRKA
jgi:diguanylate cyclase (GGDEF)-like protein